MKNCPVFFGEEICFLQRFFEKVFLIFSFHMMRFLFLTLTLSFFSACSFSSKTEEPQEPTPAQKQEKTYDMNSWKTMIPKTCESYFDGCNTCSRSADSDVAACTMMFCAEYQEPKCLDGEKEEEKKPENYTGLTVEEAQKVAAENGVPFRIIREDGEDFIVTADYVPGRVNAMVESGKVVDYEVEGEEIENAPQYDQNSWQTMIPKTCNSFFDGCNNCNRMEGEEMAACTRMFCQEYQEPKCLDEE